MAARSQKGQKDEGDMTQAEKSAAASEQAEEAASTEAKGKLREAKHKAETDDARTQAEKFEAAAREHGTDQDEETFKGVLRKLGKRTDEKR